MTSSITLCVFDGPVNGLPCESRAAEWLCVPHEGATEGHMFLALLGTTLLHPSKMVNSIPSIMHAYLLSKTVLPSDSSKYC